MSQPTAHQLTDDICKLLENGWVIQIHDGQVMMCRSEKAVVVTGQTMLDGVPNPVVYKDVSPVGCRLALEKCVAASVAVNADPHNWKKVKI